MGKQIQFDYYYGIEAEQFSFYRVPRLLIKDERFKGLSSDAKLLYGLMLDRMSLSMKNGWLDEENRAYIIYTLDNVMEDLGCAKATCVKIMKELDSDNGIGLIEKKRRGLGKPDIIYVKNFATIGEAEEETPANADVSTEVQDLNLKSSKSYTSRSSETELQEVQKADFQKSKNFTSRSTISELAEVQKADPNYTNYNHTNQSNIDRNYINPINQSGSELEGEIDVMEDVNAYMEIIKENIEYEHHMKYGRWQDKGLYEELYEVICEIVCVKHKTVKIGGNDYPYELVKSKFLKSFSAKREILSCFLMTKDDIVVCDPEGEYFALVGALHGQVVRLATNSKDYLNPMDIQLSHKGDKEALKLKSDFIITLCDLIAGGKNGLENDEKGIIDECIRHIYDAYFENPVPENMPILEDLYNALLEHKNKKAERIANSLVLYVHGSQNYFNHRTNVDSQNRIMCFDIRDLGNQLKELGMLIVQDAVWNRVSQNRERKIATRYYCDEFHLLLKEKQTAIYSVEIWKRFRKWGGIPTGLTQNVGDFLKSEEIEGILGNSDFVYLLNQNAKDQAILADKLGLSEKQLAHVTNSEPGCGLILFDNVVIPFVDKYPVDTKTFAVMNTKPEESVRQEVNE